MARSRSKSKTATTTMSAAPAPRMEMGGLKQEHKTFSHVMYFLFLISVTIAAFFTFQAFEVLARTENAEYFYVVASIMMLLWAFLFWEFGHRIHA